jgi:hypothetical protein
MMDKIRGVNLFQRAPGDNQSDSGRGSSRVGSAKESGKSDQTNQPQQQTQPEQQQQQQQQQPQLLQSADLRTRLRKQVSAMRHDEVLQEFDNHEDVIHYFLARREKIVDHASYTVYLEKADSNGTVRMPFEQFWRENCKTYASASILVFYAGSAMLFAANMVFMWSWYDLYGLSIEGAAISVSILGFSLAIAGGIVVQMRWHDYGEAFKDSKRSPSRWGKELDIPAYRGHERNSATSTLGRFQAFFNLFSNSDRSDGKKVSDEKAEKKVITPKSPPSNTLAADAASQLEMGLSTQSSYTPLDIPIG